MHQNVHWICGRYIYILMILETELENPYEGKQIASKGFEGAVEIQWNNFLGIMYANLLYINWKRLQ